MSGETCPRCGSGMHTASECSSGLCDEIDRLITERDQLKSTLATYKAAVEKAKVALELFKRGAMISNTHAVDATEWLDERDRITADALHTLSALTCDATKTP